ncbi:MAG: hypothetical protein STSR0008_09420 [Ignavibacterium sp.]
MNNFFNRTLFFFVISLTVNYSSTIELSFINNSDGLNYNINFFQEEDLNKIFSDIENGFNNGTVSSFYSHFSSQNYLSFFNGINGYFSSNQSFYVLENFFQIYHPISFKFNTINIGKNPYATGILYYDEKGKRNSAYIFVSLNQTGKNWQISQITIK